jgi:hypothetical protein
MDNPNDQPHLSGQEPPPLPSGAKPGPGLMDKIVTNISQLKRDFKGWFKALPWWRKALLGCAAVGIGLTTTDVIVGNFFSVPKSIEAEAISRKETPLAQLLYRGDYVGYEITNRYSRRQGDSTYYCEEYEAKFSNGRSATGGLRFNQRGDRWYWNSFDPRSPC